MIRRFVISLIFLAGTASAADWTKIDLATDATINKIEFYENTGFAATSDGQLLISRDGGQTWQSKKLSDSNLRDVDVLADLVFVVGKGGLVKMSTDGGKKWQDLSMDAKYDFNGVGILNDTCIAVMGNDRTTLSGIKGEVFISYDRAETWVRQRHIANALMDIDVSRPKKLYIIGAGKEIHSINWGLSYFYGSYPSDRLAFGCDLIDDYGFLVGMKGLFGYSLDHGRSWKIFDLGITKNLYAVDIPDEHSGVAVGQDGTVIYFSGDGERHTITDCGPGVDLKTVCLTDKQIFVGGEKGTMMVQDRFPHPEKETDASGK